MNELESLQIIKTMISRAKELHHRNSFYFILWGVILIVAALTEYFVAHQMNSQFGYLGWMVGGMAGGIISGVYGSRESKRLGYEAFMDKVYGATWGGFGITMVILLVCAVVNKINPIPLVLIITGLPTFVSGAITKFKPLQIGAFVFWVLGAVAFFVPIELQSLVFCAAIGLGYLLPGILLKNNETKAHVQSA
jgi:hypothetical protein